MHLRLYSLKWLPLLCLLPLVTQCDSAQPVTTRVEGIPNFDRVNANLYRGAQPNSAGIASLRRLGVKTIINLRMTNDIWAPEPALARAAGIGYTNIPLVSIQRPTDAQVAQVLAAIKTAPGPVFIHCHFGADRTGTLIACYRIKHDRWSSETALHEAVQHGMLSAETDMKRFIEEYAQSVRDEAAPSPK